MRRPELVARVLIAAAALAAVATPLWIWSRTPLIHVRMAEDGGWSPDALQARVGEPLHVRFISDDVMHGFAVGQIDMQSVDVSPGKVTNVTLNFQKPGTYTFYCTRWCGLNHWRMRGTIEVSGAEVPPVIDPVPLYVTLRLDIDAPHEIPSGQLPAISAASPHADDVGDLRWTLSRPIGGEQTAKDLPISDFTDVDFYRSHSPYATWKELRANAMLSKLDDREIWNLVAFIWQSNTSGADLAEGKKLFAQNCAACHGESGGGNGVFADELAAAGEAPGASMGEGQSMMIQRPANFADAKRMLGASPALLQGKILRGGMGTGMPSWGAIFTEGQTWKIVSYLYTFQLQEIAK